MSTFEDFERHHVSPVPLEGKFAGIVGRFRAVSMIWKRTAGKPLAQPDPTDQALATSPTANIFSYILASGQELVEQLLPSRETILRQQANERFDQLLTEIRNPHQADRSFTTQVVLAESLQAFVNSASIDLHGAIPASERAVRDIGALKTPPRQKRELAAWKISKGRTDHVVAADLLSEENLRKILRVGNEIGYFNEAASQKVLKTAKHMLATNEKLNSNAIAAACLALTRFGRPAGVRDMAADMFGYLVSRYKALQTQGNILNLLEIVENLDFPERIAEIKSQSLQPVASDFFHSGRRRAIESMGIIIRENPSFAHLANRYIEALLVTAESDPRYFLRTIALGQIKAYFETTKERGADPSRVEQRLNAIAEHSDNEHVRLNAAGAIQAFHSNVIKPVTPEAKLARSLETFETFGEHFKNEKYSQMLQKGVACEIDGRIIWLVAADINGKKTLFAYNKSSERKPDFQIAITAEDGRFNLIAEEKGREPHYQRHELALAKDGTHYAEDKWHNSSKGFPAPLMTSTSYQMADVVSHALHMIQTGVSDKLRYLSSNEHQEIMAAALDTVENTSNPDTQRAKSYQVISDLFTKAEFADTFKNGMSCVIDGKTVRMISVTVNGQKTLYIDGAGQPGFRLGITANGEFFNIDAEDARKFTLALGRTGKLHTRQNQAISSLTCPVNGDHASSVYSMIDTASQALRAILSGNGQQVQDLSALACTQIPGSAAQLVQNSSEAKVAASSQTKNHKTFETFGLVLNDAQLTGQLRDGISYKTKFGEIQLIATEEGIFAREFVGGKLDTQTRITANGKGFDIQVEGLHGRTRSVLANATLGKNGQLYGKEGREVAASAYSAVGFTARALQAIFNGSPEVRNLTAEEKRRTSKAASRIVNDPVRAKAVAEKQGNIVDFCAAHEAAFRRSNFDGPQNPTPPAQAAHPAVRLAA